MARFVSVQTNFSTGELDPLLRARVDLPAYQNALEEATNVVVQPQGGIRRRPGSRYITSIPAGSGVRLVPFEFSTSDSYMLCFTDGRMYVFKNQALVTDINGSGNNYLDTSSFGLTGARLQYICWTQSADTLIVVHEDIQPISIVRGATDASWTGAAITFDSIPKYAFDIQNFEPQGTITPSDVTGNITLDVSAYTSDTGSLQAATTTSVTLKAAASGTNDIFKGLCVVMTSGAQSGKARKISAYNGTTKVATVFPAWETAPLTGDNYKVVPFAAESVNQYVNASPQGRARITEYVSDTQVKAIVEFPFFDTTARTSGNWDLECLYEDVWSSTRGWPRSVTFHEGRLYFGGSRSRPSTIWGSKVGLFFDFNPDEGLDDDAVEGTLDTNTFNAIVDVTSGRDLQIFTTGGEFYVPQQGLDPITPTNFFVKATTRNGAKEGVRVQQLESGTLFVQRQGKSLNEFAFTDVQLTYVTTKISLLAGHLLRNPTRIALRRSVATDENDLLLITNGTDGSMAVFSLLRAQNVIAPSEFITDGEYIDVGVDLSTIYSVVKRTINGTTAYYIETFDDALQTDCAVYGSAAASTSAAHLIDETVQVILDGAIQPTQVVPAGGTVTFPRSSALSYQVGLNYTVRAVTMPTELKLSVGSRLGFKKRIVEVNALVADTQHLKINGTIVPFRNFDSATILDEPIQEFTGTKVLNGILGYSTEGKITIEQDIPLKMTLLGMEYKVATHQGT